jgi:gluconolactonase
MNEPRVIRNVRLFAVLLIAGAFLSALRAAAPVREFALRAEVPQFWKLLAHDAKLEQVATGFGFTEGPVWDPKGFVYVSDEEINKLYRVYPDGHKEELLALGDPDGNTYDFNQKLLDCASVLRAIILIEPDGKYQVLADRFEGKRFNSPNDVVMGPDGAIYFTDPTLDLPQGEKQEPFRAYTGSMQRAKSGF